LDEDKISLTYFLMASGRKDRVKTTIWLERIYKEKLKDEQMHLSDLINFLIEKYLREKGKLNVMEEIEKVKEELNRAARIV